MTVKKRVVYLFGTGASQAEASLADDSIHLLMTDVKDGILNKMIKEKNHKYQQKYKQIRDELAAEYADVEQLITLFESSGTKVHQESARFLKNQFRAEIEQQIKKLDNGGRFIPKLCSALIDMHRVDGFDEKLVGIMTLNYEDLVERAGQNVIGCVNCNLNLGNDCNTSINYKKSGLMVLKLHGSFNWKNEFPISIHDRIGKGDDVYWIPPGVEKHPYDYPFNVIWGKARELLDCDILRMVGCSLSHNDWHLVSLLYETQKLNKNNKNFTIEVIDYPDAGEAVRIKYPHLRPLKKINELLEIREFVYRSLYNLSDTGTISRLSDATICDYLAKPKNIFDIWLKAKGEQILKSGLNIDPNKNKYFSEYVKGA